MNNKGNVAIFKDTRTRDVKYIKKYRPDQRQIFINELKMLDILSASDVKYIPKLYDIDHENLQYTMEDCGKPLSELTKSEIKTYKKAIRFICDDLQNKNIHHNDVTAKNLTIREDNSLCLIDWEHVSDRENLKSGASNFCHRDNKVQSL